MQRNTYYQCIVVIITIHLKFILFTCLIYGWFRFHDLWQLKRYCIVSTTLHWAARDRVEDDGGRQGWQRHVQGVTGEDLGWQWVYRGWQGEAREYRGHVQGMTGAEKWHRGYVQGTARDGGEVQRMTSVKIGFSLGQWILISKVFLGRAHIRAFFTSLHVSLLSFCLSVHLSFRFSIHVNLFFNLHSLWIQGCYKLFCILHTAFPTKLFHFPVLLLVHVFPYFLQLLCTCFCFIHLYFKLPSIFNQTFDF